MGEITPFSCFPVINFQLTNPKPKFLISVTASNQVYFPISLQHGFLILFHRLDSDLSLTNLHLSYPPLSLSCTICSFLPSVFSLHVALYFHLIHSCCPYTNTWTWGMFLNLILHNCKDCALHNSRRCHLCCSLCEGCPLELCLEVFVTLLHFPSSVPNASLSTLWPPRKCCRQGALANDEELKVRECQVHTLNFLYWI